MNASIHLFPEQRCSLQSVTGRQQKTHNRIEYIKTQSGVLVHHRIFFSIHMHSRFMRAEHAKIHFYLLLSCGRLGITPVM